MTPVAVSVLATLAASGVAGAVAARFRLPGGVIVWAMLAAASLHLSVEPLVPLPPLLRTAAQILMGTALGAGLTRSPLRAVRRLARPLVLAMGVLLAGSFAGGFAFAAVTGLDLATALFATSPGGANDIAVAALHFDTNAALVAAFHVVRQLFIFVFVLAVFTRYLRPGPGPGPGSGRGRRVRRTARPR